MDFSWGTPQETSVVDGYLDWFDHVYQPAGGGALGYRPLLVRVKPTGRPATLLKTLRWIKRKLDAAGQGADFLIDGIERAHLDRLLAHPPAEDAAPDLFLHVSKSLGDFAAVYGRWLEPLPNGGARPPEPSTRAPAGGAPHPAPVVAVIDDAIGYLNARFTTGTAPQRKTRLAAIWLQCEDSITDTDGQIGINCGRVLQAGDIDALLAQGDRLDEPAEYSAMNKALYDRQISPVWHGITAGGGSELASTHGTIVADIAAGADPLDGADTLCACPMLAAQLPPQAVEDTSGATLQPYVLRALRWIIWQADRLQVDGQHRPLVVNISLGVLAGSKDGTSLIERQIAAEVYRREARTGRPMRVVFAFGNDGLTRQVGTFDLEPEAPQSVTLRVQSEDYTPSFVELRPEDPDALLIGMDSLLSQPLVLGTVPLGHSVSLARGSAPAVARIYAIAPQQLDGGGQTSASYLLAIAPTAAFEAGKPLAPSGPWQITLGTNAAAQTVRIEVQRDDRPLGFQALARQSYLDDTALWVWKPPVKTKYAPKADGPVTRIGTESGWLSAGMPEQVYCVGAALCDTGFAAPYCATGGPLSAREPGVSAIGDSSWTLRGVLASGTLSGSATVMSGTSVAAPQITRQLAVLFASGADIGPWHPPSINAKREMAALSALDWSYVPQYELDQLGPLAVSAEAGLRARLDNGYRP
ncbi:S8 family serine peptidase [Neptunicoccus sediminis]|uniref:S8 family serine peptidase n=1 Tax=Neptunicoccus sediminis TaxID=1892596 RepID=UPI0008460437|nr:S8 family serine peptidase [Neptunicoccus sediminis]